MNAKYFCFYIIASLLLLSRPPAAMAVTADELADICKAMESAIVDISLEYEWYNIPPWIAEEAETEMGTEMLIPKDGRRRFNFSAAGLLSDRDPNDSNSLLPDRLLLEELTTLVTKDGNAWDNVTKHSYNGKIAKRLNIGGWPREVRSGIVSDSKRFMPTLILSPLGFSVLRFNMSKVTDKLPLSAILRRKELVRLDNTVKKVNGFNTVRVDFLQEWTKQVCIRVYFSVDHGYTPVRYEYMAGGKPESNRVDFVVEVHSLEQVAEGLWFPSSGVIRSAGCERMDAFQAISKIVVNQGLTDEYFDIIDFPPGTKVRDEIKGTEYVVKSK